MESSRQLFVDMKVDTRRLRPSYVFMMRCLLYSRLETGNETGTDVPDEDVNVYLAHLLQSFSDPAYVESARPYLHRYDHEVFKRLERSTDARLKYVIYKTNADFLLVSIGVFDNPGQWLAHRLPQVQPSKNRAGEPSEEASMGRGKGGFTDVASTTGVGAFVGCLGSPSDQMAEEIGFKLHAELLKGVPIAVALHTVRLAAAVRGGRDHTWLHYALSGYPELTLR